MATTIPITGLSQIGDQLLRASGDYANIQLRRQAEERQRAQQLADLQDQRAYSEGQRSRQREQAIDDATIEVLLKEGWLKPTDVRNAEAIRVAADARQARLGTQRAREEALPDKLQSEADYLGEQDVALAQTEAALNAQLSAPQPPPPSPAEVRQIAIQMTQKPVPSDAEINAMIPAATDAIMKERLTRWMMDKEDAKVQIPLLRSQRTAIRQSLGGLLQQGFVPNRTPPPPAATLQAPAPAMRRASPEEAAAAAGGMPPPIVAPAVPQGNNYGGLMSLSGEPATLGAAFSNPVGALEIGARTAAAGPARILNYIAGGERRASEGDAARAAEMAQALQSFQSPSRPMAANPFFTGDINSPGRTLSPLPSLPPLRKAPQQSPAFQFSNSYAPGY